MSRLITRTQPMKTPTLASFVHVRRTMATRIGGVAIIVLACVACAHAASPAEQPRGSPNAIPAVAPAGVVIDVSVADPERWTMIVTNIENLQHAALGPIEVVAYGKGLGLVLATQTELGDRMAELARNGVVFSACENTLRKQHLSKADLLPFVTTVDAGVAELVRKQRAGWAYLKGG